MEIVESKTGQVRDRLEAMRFLLQIYEDEFSLFLYGPSRFLVKDVGSGSGTGTGMRDNLLHNQQQQKPPRWSWGADEDRDDPSNRAF